MIAITRLDGSTLVVNADLIETIEHSGDTVVTLVSGTRFVVREGIDELIDAVVAFRAGVLFAAERVAAATPAADDVAAKIIPLSPGRRPADGGGATGSD
jgi:flagellar protein FlbD